VNSLEIHTHAETFPIAKRRQAWDKLDTRDVAQSLFSSGRFGTVELRAARFSNFANRKLPTLPQMALPQLPPHLSLLKTRPSAL
jgi:hypothetical protein